VKCEIPQNSDSLFLESGHFLVRLLTSFGVLTRGADGRVHGEVGYPLPLHDRTVTVTQCGRICLGRKKINLSRVFAGQNVDVKEEEDGIWQVSFMHYDIGYFDLDTCRRYKM